MNRLRTQRNELATQLKDNKKERADLRKSVKDSAKQLQQLERQNRRPGNGKLVKKSRPTTPSRAVSSAGSTRRDPVRPTTAAGVNYDDIPHPSTPARPTTSAAGGNVDVDGDTPEMRHTIHFSPSTMFLDEQRPVTAAAGSGNKRWSIARPASSGARPATSAGMDERPGTSAGQEGREGVGGKKIKRKWSQRLSRFFH
jgi:hypothetical protein